MLIEQPPALFRKLFGNSLFRKPVAGRKTVYITFDDGPVPGVTPAVLEILRRHRVRATFFMVGDNVRKHPAEYGMVRREGHSLGNHTMHHLQGIRCRTKDYMEDVRAASELVPSKLFRPPHGFMRRKQLRALKEAGYSIVMYDLVTRDYSRYLSPEGVVRNVKRYVRDGSIIVFHDSEKSAPRVCEALESSLQWLEAEGYEFGLLE